MKTSDNSRAIGTIRLKHFLSCVIMCIGFCIFCLTAKAQSFGNVFMGGGGFVSGIISAPNDKDVFYIRTDVGGAYRWNESSQSWIPLTDWVSPDERGLLGIDGIAVDPQVKGRVYMLAGTSYWNNGKTFFLRSDDYGATWDKIDVTTQFKAHGNGMGRANGERLAVDPNNSNIIYCGTRYNGLWKSTNRGTSWTQVTSLNVTTTPNESGVCIITFDKNSVSNGVTQTIYAGVSRENDNLYVSNNGGTSWSLITGHPTTARIMPQRFALTGNGRYLYVTYGNGAGPHAMLWNGVSDYYNRGAVYKYDTQLKTWTDISPVNFMLDLGSINGDVVHYGAYSGISIDPTNENRIIATSINSWRGPQFWYMDGAWKDKWGDNIFVSEDGGASWREMFRYYWIDGGVKPDYKMVDENGIPWIIGNTIHWIGAAVIDPFNPNRAFVTSGNGVFSTDSLFKYYTSQDWVNNVQVTQYHGKATWKFTAKGLEETVPLDMISIPNGPVVSVIGDYDGFVHTDITAPSAAGRLMTTVNGQKSALGTTTGIAFAAQKTNVLAKASGTTAVVNNQNVTICGVQISNDTGASWNQIYANATPVSQKPAKGNLFKGKVAVSNDGAVVLWAPMSWQVSSGNVTDTIEAGHKELFMYQNSSWKKCSGIEFYCYPVADPENVNAFYAYNNTDGYLYVSTDKGATFTKKGLAGLSDFRTARTAPGRTGDIWVPLARNVNGVLSGGIARSTDGGVTFTNVANVSYCEAVGFGKEASGAVYPAVYIFGTVNSVTGVFLSIDGGTSWTRVNDDEHEYGGLANGEFIVGDANTFGLVYMSTAGRGIVYMKASTTFVNVASVTISRSTASLAIGDTCKLNATVLPANATNKGVSWSSDKTTVATVSSTGIVTGISEGEATITVKTAEGGKTASCKVTVSNIPVSVTGVTVTPSTLSFKVGATSQLEATVSPSNASNKNVSWSSSDISIAAVDSKGLVTGVAKGNAVITVTTQDGNFKAACSVNVQENSSSCSFGAPLNAGLPSVNGSYTKVYVLGSGGPDLSNVTNLTINWNLSMNGLWQLSVNTSNGNPGWWIDLRTVASWKFNQAEPEITFTNSKISALDGSYWVALDGSNFVMVSKTGGFTLYFSNSATAPTCTSTKSGLNITDVEVIEGDKPLLYPNPFTNEITLPNVSGISLIKIYNQVGKLISCQKGEEIKGNSIQIGNDLPKGMYIIEISKDGKTSSYKVIKQ